MIYQNRQPNAEELKTLNQLYAQGQHEKFNALLGEINGKYHVALVETRLEQLKVELHNFHAKLSTALEAIKSYTALAPSSRTGTSNNSYYDNLLEAVPENLINRFPQEEVNLTEYRTLAAEYEAGNTHYIWFNSPHPTPPESLIHSFHESAAAAAEELRAKLKLNEQLRGTEGGRAAGNY